jgi:CBS domain containing-hemolysin-like protein
MRFSSLQFRRRAQLSTLLLASLALPAHASFLSGDALDTMADYLALFVLFAVPIGVIVLFWLIHVLPEKIAEKRHHPQKDAIKTLCLLSLFFGGLLWPFAWLWAYTRPVGFRLAYGTEKHEDYYVEMTDKARAGELLRDEIGHLRAELDAMAARGSLPLALKDLRAELDALHARAITAEVDEATPVLSDTVTSRPTKGAP